jgi:hypothetical protein
MATSYHHQTLQGEHMSDIQLYRSSGLSPRDVRRAGQELARLDRQTDYSVAKIEAAAEVQARRADAIGAVAGRALQDVALLSQMEQQLAQTVPMASGRLAVIADSAALALADVVQDSAYRLRRC